MTDAASRRPLRLELPGRVPYGEALARQLAAAAAVKSGTGPEHLFLLEHPHVFTLGRNATPEDILAGPEWLAERGVEIAECDRGGQVTYHGPGQLVGYPVLNLSPDRRDVRRYVRDLQETLIRPPAGHGVDAAPRGGPGHIRGWAGGGKKAPHGGPP